MDLLKEEEFQLHVTPLNRSNMKAIAKWANFLSIVGFVFILLIVIVALFANKIYGSLFAGMPGSPYQNGSGFIITAVYLVIALIYFFPTLFHFQFARKLKKAVNEYDVKAFTEAFTKLKMAYIFIGVLTILILAVYLFAFLALIAFK